MLCHPFVSMTGSTCMLLSFLSRVCARVCARGYHGCWTIKMKKLLLFHLDNAEISYTCCKPWHFTINQCKNDLLDAPRVCLNMHTRVWHESSITRGKWTFVYCCVCSSVVNVSRSSEHLFYTSCLGFHLCLGQRQRWQGPWQLQLWRLHQLHLDPVR